MTYLTRPDLLSTAPGVQLIKTCEQREISLGFGCDRDVSLTLLLLARSILLTTFSRAVSSGGADASQDRRVEGEFRRRAPFSLSLDTNEPYLSLKPYY